MRTRSGQLLTGVNLDAYLGRMAVCAEAVALGRAVTDLGETGIDIIVAVRHPKPTEADQTIAVVSPCGACREMIWDYDRNARVIVPQERGRRSSASPSSCRTNTAASGSREGGLVTANSRRSLDLERREEDAAETSLRPQKLVRIHRPAAGARQPLGVHRSRAQAQRGARPRAVRRAAGARQDHAGADRLARTGRQLPRHLRARHRQGRRPRGAADQSRRARCAVHRRDPPAQSRRSRKSSIRRWRTFSST